MAFDIRQKLLFSCISIQAKCLEITPASVKLRRFYDIQEVHSSIQARAHVGSVFYPLLYALTGIYITNVC